MNKKVVIIAEAGVNHNGDINLAKKMIDVAKNAGVDYVKFQTFTAKGLANKDAKKADYQLTNDNDTSQYNMLKNLEISFQDHITLIDYSKQKKIKFFSTAFDNDGLDFLNSLNFEFFKIPSGEITNYPYLKKLSIIGKPVILSTGMSNKEEIKKALNILTSNTLNIEDIVVLHCNTDYPTAYNDVNLKAMLDIKETFNVKVGYSDHTLGIEVPIASVALGACVIEKHFTLDRKMKGPDHSASLEPNELIDMVQGIRNIEKAISGSGFKNPTESELKNQSISRKSIFLKKDVKKGDLFTEELINTLRPGTGLSPMLIPQLLNKKFNKKLKKNNKLKLGDLD